jgi:hypothetical protein
MILKLKNLLIRKKVSMQNLRRKDVYKLIDEEREYQIARWNESTTLSGGIHSPEEWLTYMEVYIRKAQETLAGSSVQDSYPKAMEIIRKITAMGVAAMEQIDTPARKG